MLGKLGELPPLLNYQGLSYKITDIIGQLRFDKQTKELIIHVDEETGFMLDDNNRRINSTGYLIDKQGNIINQNGKIIFNFWECIQSEPPKFFNFTEWSMDWILGNHGEEIFSFDPCQDDIYDQDGHLVNTMGYLIDRSENIVSKQGDIVFSRELLGEKLGQDSEIPKLFRSAKLDKP